MSRLLPLALLVLAACDKTAEPTDPTDTPTPAVTWDEVHPIFADKCGPCHTTAANGGHSMGGADADSAYDDSQVDRNGQTRGELAYDRILAGTMPPGCSGDPEQDADIIDFCLTQAEQDTVDQWITDGQQR